MLFIQGYSLWNEEFPYEPFNLHLCNGGNRYIRRYVTREDTDYFRTKMKELYDIDIPEDFIVHGPNRMTSLPMDIPISYQEMAHCLDKSLSKMDSAILSALEQTPPELYADIVRNGIYLTGGGALLRGLSKRFYDRIGIPFHVAEDPLHAVAKGTGIALKNIEKFNFLMR